MALQENVVMTERLASLDKYAREKMDAAPFLFSSVTLSPHHRPGTEEDGLVDGNAKASMDDAI